MANKPLFQNGTKTDVACPECGGKLRVRTNSHTGSQFLGCPSYPNCRYARGIPREMTMKALGHQMLPGMGSP